MYELDHFQALRLPGLDNVKITVSSTSSKESSTILAIVIVPDVWPAAIVSVPFAKVRNPCLIPLLFLLQHS